MVNILYLSTLLIMWLFAFNGPFVSRNSYINFISIEFNPPNIMLHIGCKMHLVAHPMFAWKVALYSSHGPNKSLTNTYEIDFLSASNTLVCVKQNWSFIKPPPQRWGA